MEQRNTRLRNAGFVTFFFSGICTISSGVVVSLLQEEYGFALSLIHILYAFSLIFGQITGVELVILALLGDQLVVAAALDRCV